MSISYRKETPADGEGIRRVNTLAFSQPAEADLVDILRSEGFVRLSLVAVSETDLIGHILFSDLPIITEQGTIPTLAMGAMLSRHVVPSEHAVAILAGGMVTRLPA